MKKLALLTSAIIIMLISQTGFSNPITANLNDGDGKVVKEMKVYGECGMCKNRIEAAVKNVRGVEAANWDVDSKILTVTYDEEKTNLGKIHLAITKKGYDTEFGRAEDVDYKNLPGCCQYERKPLEENISN